MDNNQSLLQQVLDRYGLSDATANPLVSYNNQVYRIESANGQRYSLRICGFAEMNRRWFEDELIWLDFVAQRNPRLAPRPIANEQGELVTVIASPEGDRLCCLFAWIEGSELQHDLTPANLREIGRSVAELHNIAREFPFPDATNDFRGEYRYDQSLVRSQREWIEQHRDEIGAENVALLERAVGYVLTEMDRIGQTRATYGFIHADLHFGNLLVQDEQIYVIDFEQLGRGHFLYDFACLWIELPDEEEKFVPLWQSFVAGYSEVTELPFRKEEELSPFIVIGRLNFLDWFYNATNPAVRADKGHLVPITIESIRQRVDMNRH